MIHARIQIEDGDILDITSAFGLVYLNGSKIFAAPVEDFEKSSFPEQSGVNMIPKTVDKEFEYKVEFFIKTDRLTRANKKINNFNKSLYTQSGDVKTFKRIAFYDDYKGVKIVGYPIPIQEATEFWRDKNGVQSDVVCCEWVIKVDKPHLCDFDYGDASVVGDILVIDGDMLANGNIVAGVEVYVEDETLIFKNV